MKPKPPLENLGEFIPGNTLYNTDNRGRVDVTADPDDTSSSRVTVNMFGRGECIQILEQHPTRESYIKVKKIDRSGEEDYLDSTLGAFPEAWISRQSISGLWALNKRHGADLSRERSGELLSTRFGAVDFRKTDTVDDVRALMLEALKVRKSRKRK